MATLLTVLWLITFTTYCFAASTDVHGDIQRYTLVGFLLLVLLMMAWPGPQFYRSTRWYLAKLLFRTVTSPFAKVQFKEAFFADQLTSMVRFVTDLAYTTCYYTTAAFLLDDNSGAQHCIDQITYSAWAVSCAPHYFRLMQCFKRYYDTREAMPHLANAGKYSVAIFISIMSLLANNHYKVRAPMTPLVYFCACLACM